MLRIILLLIFVLSFSSCSKDETIYQPTEVKNPYELYNEGMAAFEKNNFFLANKKFTEAELNFKEIELAAKSAIMSCFSLYGINFYTDALENLDRFIKTYPSDKNIIYAHYLEAIIYFEQINDEKKRLRANFKS